MISGSQRVDEGPALVMGNLQGQLPGIIHHIPVEDHFGPVALRGDDLDERSAQGHDNPGPDPKRRQW